MSSSNGDESTDSKDDSRIPCKYGINCYQKNDEHHSKYTHPRKIDKKETSNKDKKRKKPIDNEKKSQDSQTSKQSRIDFLFAKQKQRESIPSPSDDTSTSKEKTEPLPSSNDDNNKLPESNDSEKLYPIDWNMKTSEIITDLFFTEMPEDFYQLYEFCKTVCKEDPSMVFKPADLILVGPYDVLNEKLKDAKVIDKKMFLTHWRYYYDPPEFQTIIKGNDKEGLHYGYWRDDISTKQTIVVKNCANKDCKIEPIADNIFGAIDLHLEETLQKCNPFAKSNLHHLQRKLRAFAKDHEIDVSQTKTKIKNREKQIMAKTLHRAGIVVPYNKKTQVGYRDLAVTDYELIKIFKNIKEASTPEERLKPLSELEEVVRLAVIATDECDFGTCLELGHDLFSSGLVHVQNMAERMLKTAYTLLNRLQFIDIVHLHLQNRKKNCQLLSVGSKINK